MNTVRRTATRITDRHTQLRYGASGILARFLMVKHEDDGSWTLSGARGPLGSPNNTFEDRGYRTKRDAYAAADTLAALDLTER